VTRKDLVAVFLCYADAHRHGRQVQIACLGHVLGSYGCAVVTKNNCYDLVWPGNSAIANWELVVSPAQHFKIYSTPAWLRAARRAVDRWLR
jgi:hypothetical protein